MVKLSLSPVSSGAFHLPNVRRNQYLRPVLLFLIICPALIYLHRLLFLYYSNIPLIPLRNTPQPTEKITIVTVFHEQTPLYQASLLNHEQYAKAHGYIYKPMTFDFMIMETGKYRKTYNKIAHLIRETLDCMERGGGWIL